MQGKEKSVYFVQGHGERDTAGSDRRTGYSGIAQVLQIDNFKVEKLGLLQQKSVPAEATVLVIAGPQADYTPDEIAMVRDYLQRGGRALVMLDPPTRADAAPLTNLVALLHDWGIDAGNDIVVDVSGRSNEPSLPVAMPPYPSHPVVDRFELFTVYPIARSMTPVSGGVNGRTAQPIIETSPRSWAETDIKSLLTTGRLTSDAAKGDKTGPIPLGAAVSATAPEAPSPPKPENQVEATKEEEPKKPETRVVAIGDSDFASNGFLGTVGSRDLFMNALNWLAGQENMIAIRPREAQDRRLSMTADQQRFMMLLTIFIIPGAILIGRGRTPGGRGGKWVGCSPSSPCSSSASVSAPTFTSSSASGAPARSPTPKRRSSPASRRTRSRRSRSRSRTATARRSRRPEATGRSSRP